MSRFGVPDDTTSDRGGDQTNWKDKRGGTQTFPISKHREHRACEPYCRGRTDQAWFPTKQSTEGVELLLGFEPAEHPTRKIMSMFQVVKFPNEACAGGDSKNGTCYTANECKARGGTNGGACAAGFGVCCTFSLGCDSVSKENSTYFVSPGKTIEGTCRSKVCKNNDNICQIRLDLLSFSTAGPEITDVVGGQFLGEEITLSGVCIKDTFAVINPGGSPTPTICGENGGEHMYVNFGSECMDLVFDLGSGTDAEWTIQASQYECDYDNLAPTGCLQYMFGRDEGTIQSFNFDLDQHLADQRQKVCIRREINQCELCYFFESKKTDMRLSTADFKDQCCGYGDDGTDNGEGADCLVIPSLFYFDDNGEKVNLEESEFCGADSSTFSDAYDEFAKTVIKRLPTASAATTTSAAPIAATVASASASKSATTASTASRASETGVGQLLELRVDNLLGLGKDGHEIIGFGRVSRVLAHIHDLEDVVIGVKCEGTNVDLHVVLEEVLGQTPHFLGPGGTPHEHLSIRSDLLDDLTDLRLEAHVQHAVGLVQNEIGSPAQVGLAHFQEIDQSTGGSNDHLTAILEIAKLRAFGSTSEHASVPDLGGAAEFRAHLLDLLGQLTGGSQNQNNGSIASFQIGLMIDMDDTRQEVAQCLTRSGHGNAHHVESRESDGPALRLNGSGCGEALSLHFFHDVFRKASLEEIGDGIREIAALDDRDLASFAVLLHGCRVSIGQIGMGIVEVLFERHQVVLVPLDAAKPFSRLFVLHSTASETVSAATETTAATAASTVTEASTTTTAVASTAVAASATTGAASTSISSGTSTGSTTIHLNMSRG
eukprot:maker-scaffold82_size396747-snap-gene-2.39 protein:Tk06845 transcript:maker-scaffold82_size396747-snap-gene-2.39-mRNA-1 annotation:"hypothetical protein TcasGA2_TC015389"